MTCLKNASCTSQIIIGYKDRGIEERVMKEAHSLWWEFRYIMDMVYILDK